VISELFAERLASAPARPIVRGMLQVVALDRIFRALSDPARRWMVEMLCDDAASVSWLAEPLPIALSTILQHLKVLEASGLICTGKAGRVRMCHIEPQALRLLDEWLTPRRRLWERRVTRI